MVEYLLELEMGLGRLLVELPRLEDGVYRADDIADEVLRLVGELAGGDI